MNELQTAKVIKYTRQIEGILEDMGAKGKGLHGKLSSVEKKLPKALVKKLRFIAAIRNKSMHTHDFQIEDFPDFEQTCKSAIDELKSLKKTNIFGAILTKIRNIFK